MKYIDVDGDTWADTGDGRLVCTRSSVAGFEGVERARSYVEEAHGPLVGLSDDIPAEPQNAPSPALPTVDGVMSRASVFQSAHDLVTGLQWGDEENPSVYDVLSVAKWLEGDE